MLKITTTRQALEAIVGYIEREGEKTMMYDGRCEARQILWEMATHALDQLDD